MSNKKYNPFEEMYNFNANSSNWVQRLGYNADFYNNPLGYNSSPTPRPYDNTTVFGADDDNEVISGFKPQTPRTTSLNNSFNVNKQQASMGNMSSFNLKGNNNTSNFNANSSNWVQKLGHNVDFYNNPLGYNSSPTPRPYDNTTASGINNINHSSGEETLKPLNEQQKIEAQKLANKIRPKNITISESDKMLIENPIARKVGLIYQGMANSIFNPFGYLARGMGINTSPINPETGTERIIENVSSSLYDTIPMIGGGYLLANKIPTIRAMALSSERLPRVIGQGIRQLSHPAAPLYEIGATIGGTALPSYINIPYPGDDSSFIDKSKYFATNTLLTALGAIAGGSVPFLRNPIKSVIAQTDNSLRNYIDGHKIGKAYDTLKQNPLHGSGKDVIVDIKRTGKPSVLLQRGEAIIDDNGNIITWGKRLRPTGTKRNFGLNKIIYKHNMPKDEVKKLPYYLRNNNPVEVTPYQQEIYDIPNGNNEITRIALTPQDDKYFVASMYKKER